MTQSLVFILGDTPNEPLSWGLVSEGALLESGRLQNADELQTLAARAETAERCAAFIKGEFVSIRSVPRAPNGEKRLRAAARLIFEDELAESVDLVHVAVSGGAPGGAAIAAAVRRDVLEQWRGAFAAAGVPLAALVADNQALTNPEGSAIVIVGDRIIANLGQSGFSTEAELLSANALKSLIGDQTIVWANEADWRRFALREGAMRAGGAQPEDLLELFEKSLDRPRTVNLLQGEFRPKTALRLFSAEWNRAAIGGAIAASLAVLAILADGYRDQRLAAHWRIAMEGAHHLAFPDVPVAQAVANARALAAAKTSASFGAFASEVAQAAPDPSLIEITRIRYDAVSNEFLVSVKSASDTEIEAMKSRLAGRGLSASDNGGYRRNGAIWAGELVVKKP